MLGFGKKKTQSTADGFEIPSFPLTVLNLLTKLRNPDISTTELATDLEVDPGLHVRVLKMVNSAAFGLTRKVSNIQHAVSLLGRSRLESLVLSVAVKNSLTQDSKAHWLNMTEFWNTASRRAAIARGLATELHPQVQSDVFTIGLLQDMAVPVLANREGNREGNRYRDIYQAWQQSDDYELCEQEKRHCGVNHAPWAPSWRKAGDSPFR
ncbi:MAG TPA: HDOD domain-containing protein [Malonomonas sp.]